MNSLLEMLNQATKDKPVTRYMIITTFGVSDREARRMVEALRDKGKRVCGTSDGKGYWIAKTESEYLAFRRDYVSRATTILARAVRMDNAVEGQMEMEVKNADMQ